MERRGILLVELGGTIGRVGLALPGSPPAVRTLRAENRHARDLVPAIRDLLDEAALPVAQLQGIGVSIGPGGYTGLRVGITCAKTLAFVGGATLHGVPTFDWMVGTAEGRAERCILMADALKDQVYVQVFDRTPERVWESVLPLGVRPRKAMTEYRTAGTLAIVDAKLAAKVADDFPKVLIREEIGDGAIMEALAEKVLTGKYRVGRPADLEPLYLRGSSAEELRKSSGH